MDDIRKFELTETQAEALDAIFESELQANEAIAEEAIFGSDGERAPATVGMIEKLRGRGFIWPDRLKLTGDGARALELHLVMTEADQSQIGQIGLLKKAKRRQEEEIALRSAMEDEKKAAADADAEEPPIEGEAP